MKITPNITSQSYFYFKYVHIRMHEEYKLLLISFKYNGSIYWRYRNPYFILKIIIKRLKAGLANIGDPINDTIFINPNPNPVAAVVLYDNRSFWHDLSIDKRILPLNCRLSNRPFHSNQLRPWFLTCKLRLKLKRLVSD